MCMSAGPEFLINGDGAVAVILRNWLPPEAADVLHDRLEQGLLWEQKEQNFYGNVSSVPRMMCAVGEPHLGEYKYTRVSLTMHDWTGPHPLFSEVRTLRDRIRDDPTLLKIVGIPLPYDGCLLNKYKDGSDTIDFHSDREALGPCNAVVALSLGASRKFVFKSKTKGPSATFPACPPSRYPRIETVVHSGDLMLMAGKCQDLWTHSVPRDTDCKQSRISMTYRLIGKQ